MIYVWGVSGGCCDGRELSVGRVAQAWLIFFCTDQKITWYAEKWIWGWDPTYERTCKGKPDGIERMVEKAKTVVLQIVVNFAETLLKSIHLVVKMEK